MSTPSWLAPDPSLRKSIDDRIEASLPSADPPHGFYWAEAMIGLEHPIISIDLEEQYELGQRTGVRVRHPYWDVDLVEFLMRTPWDLLNGKGKSKGLVREALASRFPALGFERQKKVSALPYYHKPNDDRDARALARHWRSARPRRTGHRRPGDLRRVR